MYTKVHNPHAAIRRWISDTVPAAFRSYSKEDQVWLVHRKYLGQLVTFGKKKHGHVDYSELSTTDQIYIASEKRRASIGRVQRDPYAVLHLTHDAPMLIVKAAWRALLKEHHPDHGGDREVFEEYKNAYETITS